MTFDHDVTSTPYAFESYKSEYAKVIEQMKSYNISEETVRLVYEGQICRQKLFETITVRAPLSDDQVWARHILVEDATTAQNVR